MTVLDVIGFLAGLILVGIFLYGLFQRKPGEGRLYYPKKSKGE